MGNTRQGLTLALISLVVLAFSVAGIVAAFVARIALDIDGILLIGTCLLMGGLFTLMLFLTVREQGWLPSRTKQESPTASSSSSEAKSAPQDAR
jgi:hypothetical protein